MKNQNFKFAMVKAFLLFSFLLNVLNAQSPNYRESVNTTFASKDIYTEKLNLKPKSSDSFSIKLDEKKMIKVQIAGGDLGSGRIVAEVYGPNGNKVSSGAKEFSFSTNNMKGEYKFVVTNKTEKHQNVEVSVIHFVQSNTTIGSDDEYTKKLNLKPKSSERFSLKLDERKMIKVQISSGDLGSGRIVTEVYDPSGNRVASGTKEFSFNTKSIKSNYKFVVTNKTENHQSVEISINTSGN